MKERVYVFLDTSLCDQQIAVQTGHLAMESARQFQMDKHPSILLMAMKPGQKEKIQLKLEKLGIKSVQFFEPLFNRETGIATEPITEEQAKKLSEFPLLKQKDFSPRECV